MNCPNCKAYNPSSARFCAECGRAMAAPHDEAGNSQDQGPGQLEGSTGPYFPVPVDRPPGQFTPMGIGQLVSETYMVYRANFGVMLRIALIAHMPLIVSSFFPDPALAVALGIAGLFTGLLANGAATYVVGQHYLGHTVTAAGSYVAALNNAISLLLAFIVFALAFGTALVLSLMLIGIPALIYIVVIWFFYVQAIMIERQGPLTALGRSWRLVHGTWWRVFGIGVVFVLLLLAVEIVASLPGFVLAAANETLGSLLITLGMMSVTPIFYVGAVLVYLDLRARKEGYSLEMLASEIG